MKFLFRYLLIVGLLYPAMYTSGQSYQTIKNAHSHNDYFRNVPFYTAYSQRFSSIEADLFAIDGELYVAHERNQITPSRTFRSLYLEPIIREMNLNRGKGYPEGEGFQLLIDLKTNYKETLPLLEKQLLEYKDYFDTRQNPSAVKIVISGSRPAPAQFGDYNPIIWFDGLPEVSYSPTEKARIALISAPFTAYSSWNGLGRMTHPDYATVKKLIDQVHYNGFKIRFWGCPDTKTTWNTFIKLGVDYLNTDRPEALAQFLSTYTTNLYQSATRHAVYIPQLPDGNTDRKPKNVILLISDGGGMSQLWAAATANGGRLNILNIKNIGLLKNNPLDDYTTDSAGAGSALATGRKSRNRYIGTDTLGIALPNLTEQLSARGFKTAIITNDGLTGATPAAFYAHQTERNASREIANDLLKSPVNIVIAGCPELIQEDTELKSKLTGQKAILGNLTSMSEFNPDKKTICNGEDGKDNHFRVIENALPKVLQAFSSSSKGFFIMAEGAKIDKGGHANDMKTVVDEYLSFDKAVGMALEFADRNKETLVLVVSDHETGGLTLIDGDYRQGSILGDFSTPDHTGIPILLFAYGASAEKFKGLDENTSLYSKIIELIK